MKLTSGIQTYLPPVRQIDDHGHLFVTPAIKQGLDLNGLTPILIQSTVNPIWTLPL